MALIKTVSRIALWTFAVLAGAVILLYILASWKPTRYTPPRLTQAENEVAARQFYSEVAEFRNKGQEENEPYVWRLYEHQVNRYLDSMDEIAFQRPDQPGNPRRRGDIHRMMDKAGLAEPVLHFHNDKVTIMIRTNEFGKILSADLSFTFVEGDKLTIALESARVGLLPVPRFAVRDRLNRFKKQLQERIPQPQEDDEHLSENPFGLIDLSDMFATIIAAIDEEPLPARIKFIDAKIRNIIIEDGVMTLEIVPQTREYDQLDEYAGD